MKPRPKAETWECRVALPSEWSQTLGCWFGQFPGGDQLASLYFQLEHESGLADGLWIARREDEIDAVVWMVPGAVRFAYCWPLRYRLDLKAEAAQLAACQLWRHVSKEYYSRGVKFFQINVPIANQADVEQMKAVGFSEVTRIQRLRVSAMKDWGKGVQLVELVPFHQEPGQSFNRLLIASMEESQDVPELNRCQSLEDVAAQYDKPEIKRYFIKHYYRGIVGVLALEIEDDLGRLRYIGLPPSGRSEGWGSQAVRLAVQLMKEEGCEMIELRVDARNDMALNAYRSAGFQKVDEEVMMIFS